MRSEDSSRNATSNGYTGSSNGSTPRKPTHTSVNGHSSTINGSGPGHANGTRKVSSPIRHPYYRGHNREELTRILIQGLIDMGYGKTASTLSSESGYELESGAVAAFRSAILEGDWSEAEGLLLGIHPNDNGGNSIDTTQYGGGLVLAEGANKAQMLFSMRQQKFLELLSQRDLGQALMVLRQDLAPLNHDVHQLHVLSSLLMCPAEDLQKQAEWPGTVEDSRKALLSDLTKSIAPSVMIRDHRLAELLDQVKEAQINKCSYHNTSVPPSLYSDHKCNKDDFPSQTFVQLDQHTGEVFHVQFSHDGTKLATASEDKTVIIYDTSTFSVLHRLTDHGKEVVYISWSPDDKKLISCSKDCKARVWDVESGGLRAELEHGSTDSGYFVTSAAWLPDSMRFVTTSHDSKTPICLWSLESAEPPQPRFQGSEALKQIHTWTNANSRSQMRASECTVTPDGRRLIVTDMKCILHVYDMLTYREEYPIQFSSRLTSLTASQDSRTLLVNLTECEVHLVDLENGYIIRKFKGQKQGEYIIRSCFGGAAENFIVSGSEDGKVYIWHKENAALIETLKGHGRGQEGKDCVTTVAWNPKDAGMFASGGDDRKVRVWANRFPSNESVASMDQGGDPSRTSAIRSTYRAESHL